MKQKPVLTRPVFPCPFVKYVPIGRVPDVIRTTTGLAAI